MKKRELRIAVVAFAILTAGGVTLLGWSGLRSGVPEDSTVIAVVNTRAIPYSEMKVTVETAKNRFLYENDREPVSAEDLQEVEALRQTSELPRLARLIRAIVHEQMVSRLGVATSEVEIQERLERLYREKDFDPTFEKMRAQLAPRIRALKAVYEKSEPADAVFETHLAAKMSRVEWKALLHQYRGAEARRLLEQMASENSLESFHLEAAQMTLRMEKTREAVIQELIRTDPEFAEHRRLAATDPGNPFVQSKGINYVGAKIAAWWEERYREADVEILDPRFEPVLELINQVPASRRGETSKR